VTISSIDRVNKASTEKKNSAVTISIIGKQSEYREEERRRNEAVTSSIIDKQSE